MTIRSFIPTCLAASWLTGRRPRNNIAASVPEVQAFHRTSLPATQHLDPALEQWRAEIIAPNRSSVAELWPVAIAEIRSASSQLLRRDDGSYEKHVNLADVPQFCFYPGVIHGGLLATILDEAFAEVCSPAFTADLGVSYRAPLRSGIMVRVAVWVSRAEARKRWVVGKIESVAENSNGDRITFTEAKALFVLPRSIDKKATSLNAQNDHGTPPRRVTALDKVNDSGHDGGGCDSNSPGRKGSHQRLPVLGMRLPLALTVCSPMQGSEFLGFEEVIGGEKGGLIGV